jgi:predicted phage baseplate assembly protein
MPLPVPSLDDRSFEDLFQEARNRIQAHTPEWTQINPGDPGVALIDLFAWLAETILYRQNLIPLRQRRAFLNLLAIPMRPATPASGVVCLDAPPVLALPPTIPVHQAQLTAAGSPVLFTNTTESQPTWLGVAPMIKATFQEPDPVKRETTLALLRELYGIDTPTPFVAQTALQDGAVTLSNTLDQALYLALVKPQKLADDVATLRQTLAGGVTLSIGIAPPDGTTGQAVTDPPPRRLVWSMASTAADGSLRWLPLEVLLDTSNGGRKLGVVQLQLPQSASVLAPPAVTDPMNAGLGASPPELPADVKPERLVAWLRLTSPDDPSLSLAWLGVNAVGVIAQTVGRDALLGIGTGEPDQSFALNVAPVDPASLTIEVWPPAVGTTAAPPSTWLAVDHFGAAGRDDKVFVLDPAAGTLRFGDGMRGARVPNGAAVYARRYAYGGGQAGNLAPGSIKQLAAGGGIVVRHQWATSGGTEGETVAAAERRIPAYLANRDRAVTAEDFRFLAENVPGADVARAEVMSGMMPGADPAATRFEVPGALSVFVIPPAPQRVGGAPRPTLGLLHPVFDFLRQRTLIGTQVFVLGPYYVQLGVAIAVRLLNPATRTETLQAVEQSLVAYLWALEPGGPLQQGWPIGRPIAPHELATQASRAPGVLAVDQVTIYAATPSGWIAQLDTLTLPPYALPDLAAVAASVTGDPAGPMPPWDDPPAPPIYPVPFVPERC